MHELIILIMSFIALMWAANHLVSGTARLAAYFQLSPFSLGLTLTALISFAPELFLNLHRANQFIIGNAIGSNIANIGLVLGLTLLLRPTTLNYDTLKKAYPILILVMLFAYTLILDGFLGTMDGCLFLVACIVAITVFIEGKNSNPKTDSAFEQFKSAAASSHSIAANCLSLLIGLVILSLSIKYFISSASELAKCCSLSLSVIGLTIQAIGATLPELATALIAVFKGEEEIAIGTILGSNCYNLLAIMLYPALIHPVKINNVVIWRDMPVMIALTILLFILNKTYKKSLSRWHGGILLLIYFSYMAALVLKASN